MTETQKEATTNKAAPLVVNVERPVSCHNCYGLGKTTYNPNLNPNVFPGTASAKCTRCNGTGIEEEGN